LFQWRKPGVLFYDIHNLAVKKEGNTKEEKNYIWLESEPNNMKAVRGDPLVGNQLLCII
jgi:hypothetical protein